MNDLIDKWEKLAKKYEDRARDHHNAYTKERLYASAETLSLCADELRRLAPQKVAQVTKPAVSPYDWEQPYPTEGNGD